MDNIQKCEKCLYYKNKQKCGECGRLSNAMDNNPMFTPNTNYDRIKSMSVEEMAKFLTAKLGSAYDDGYGNWNADYINEEFQKQWLLQEVSNE